MDFAEGRPSECGCGRLLTPDGICVRCSITAAHRHGMHLGSYLQRVEKDEREAVERMADRWECYDDGVYAE